MKDDELVKELVKRGSVANDGYFEYANIVAVNIDKKLIESLEQLVNGPVFDGDVISKQCRDDLLSLGLAVRVCHKGEQGFTGATYFAHTVSKTLKSL